MPKTTKDGRPKQSELPSTLKKSPAKAQRTFAKAHDGAAEQYGEGERAMRTAYAALKRGHEKVGDHWEPKPDGKKGPSEPQGRKRSPKGTPIGARGAPTHGGVDANASKAHLYDVAKRLGVEGRSTMTKGELVEAIDKANRRETSKGRRRS